MVLAPSTWLAIALFCVPMYWGRSVDAADYAQARSAFYAGEYDACIEMTREEVDRGIWNDFWARQLIRTLLETGRYEEARQVYEQVETKFSRSIPLRVLAADAYRYCGQAETGERLLAEIPGLVQSAPWRYSDRDNLLAIGKYFLRQGADAREVLKSFFDRILNNDAEYVDAHVAIAELALDKSDYQEAVRSLELARKLRPEDPHICYLLSRAWSPSDPAIAQEHLAAGLELNRSHPDSLLLQAENLIDAEQYDEAEEVLQSVHAVNPSHPRGWALLAAIAHLRGEYQREGEYRAKGLSSWQLNPEVDFLAGATLSKHYRFSEGAKYQRRALRMNPRFMPARFQLAQDLLRVGEEVEGWSIVEQVADADKYNVVAYNLKTLQDRLQSFTTIETSDFVVRMDAREAKIYGTRALQLLEEAKSVLSAKYEFTLAEPVTVEIYPQQSDFAIRTFGLPGGAGYLGVCFGSLITANSPASQGESPANWESVLWHEFCHVVTLQKTKNRMPRWLSEGISVYEEVERDASWGQAMNPTYKSMLLSEDFVPLSQLSGAFLRPKSPLHLQFAYFESSLAVRYLIEKHGLPRLRRLLGELGIGIRIEEAFERLYGDSAALDRDFKAYVEEQANSFNSDTDFSSGELPPRMSTKELQQWLEEHPNSYVAQRRLVAGLVQSGNWDKALPAARQLVALYPEDAEPGGGLDLLATIARELGKTELEADALDRIVKYSSDNVPALTRLIALSRQEEDYAALARYSRQLLAVQPLIPTGHEGVVDVYRELGKPGQARGALRALQQMEPLDPSGLHFQLAEALFDSDMMEEARREVLLALEYAPRYREAQRLLVKVHRRLHPPADKLDLRRPDIGRPPAPKIMETKED